MEVFTTDRIRNVVLLGHGGAGKTSLVEAMAYLSGMTTRMGKISDGNTISDFDKEEIKNMAFSELYTRCQSTISTLAVCGINSRILNSDELVELLYVAYNRDESEIYGLDKALEAEYDALYSTAPDVLDKKMKELDKQIAQEAFEKANEKVYEAQSEKQKQLEKKENTREELINRMAKLIIEQNRAAIGDDIAEKATEKIDKEKTKEKGGTENGKKTKRRTTKTA